MTNRQEDRFVDLFSLPTHVRTALRAMIEFAETRDDMGYDPEYFREDLPRIVATALNAKEPPPG